MFKIVQKQTYTVLSHRYSVLLIFAGVVFVLVSAFQFGEVAMEWSRDQYSALFNIYHDNIAGVAFQNRMCLPIPIDAVYTWVNGSDPKLIADLRKVKLELELKQNYSSSTDSPGNKTSSIQCKLQDCLPIKLVVLDVAFPSTVTIQQLGESHPTFLTASRVFNLTKDGGAVISAVEFIKHEDVDVLMRGERIIYLGNKNISLSRGYLTSDWTAEKSIPMKELILATGVGKDANEETVRNAIPEDQRHHVTKIEIEVIAGMAILTLSNTDAAKGIITEGDRTEGEESIRFMSSYLIWGLEHDVPAVDEDVSASRFEDNEELRYSLRSLEKHAPWIRHVYIVTNGQIPSWLNLDNPRMTLVSHEEIFPNKTHLPSFSSPAIESHLHRIPGLSKKFIYLNDDTMFGKEVWPDDFYTHARGQKVYLTWPVPNCAEGCPSSWIRDNYCDKACNTSECDWDGGDCDASRTGGDAAQGGPAGGAYLEQMYCNSGCANGWVADKYCDQACNVQSCGFDAGDCGTVNFHRVHSVKILGPTQVTLPRGLTVALFNVSTIFSPNGSITEGRYLNNKAVRTATVAQKFFTVHLLLYRNISETTLTFTVEGKKAEVPVNVTFNVTVNTLPVQDTAVSVLSEDTGDAKDKKANDTKAASEEETFLFPDVAEELREPHKPVKPVRGMIREDEIPLIEAEFLTDDIAAKLKALDDELEQGDITEKGFKKHKAKLLQEYKKSPEYKTKRDAALKVPPPEKIADLQQQPVAKQPVRTELDQKDAPLIKEHVKKTDENVDLSRIMSARKRAEEREKVYHKRQQPKDGGLLHKDFKETGMPFGQKQGLPIGADQQGLNMGQQGQDMGQQVLHMEQQLLPGGGQQQISNMGQQVPGFGHQGPGMGQQVPVVGMRQQVPGVQQQVPGMGQQVPGMEQQVPGMGQQVPGMGQQVQGMGQQMPGMGQQVPGMGQQAPHMRQQVPGMGQQVPGMGQQVPGMGQQVPGMGQQVPGMGQQVPGMGQQVPGMGQQVPGMGQQVPGVGQQLPVVGHQVPNQQVPNQQVPFKRQQAADFGQHIPDVAQPMPDKQKPFMAQQPQQNIDQQVPNMQRQVPNAGQVPNLLQQQPAAAGHQVPNGAQVPLMQQQVLQQQMPQQQVPQQQVLQQQMPQKQVPQKQVPQQQVLQKQVLQQQVPQQQVLQQQVLQQQVLQQQVPQQAQGMQDVPGSKQLHHKVPLQPGEKRQDGGVLSDLNQKQQNAPINAQGKNPILPQGEQDNVVKLKNVVNRGGQDHVPQKVADVQGVLQQGKANAGLRAEQREDVHKVGKRGNVVQIEGGELGEGRQEQQQEMDQVDEVKNQQDRLRDMHYFHAKKNRKPAENDAGFVNDDDILGDGGGQGPNRQLLSVVETDNLALNLSYSKEPYREHFKIKSSTSNVHLNAKNNVPQLKTLHSGKTNSIKASKYETMRITEGYEGNSINKKTQQVKLKMSSNSNKEAKAVNYASNAREDKKDVLMVNGVSEEEERERREKMERFSKLTSFLPWERDDALANITQLFPEAAKQMQAAYKTEGAPRRKLMDAFSDSLRYVNKLYNTKFGFTSRKVPAHMPHMIDVDIMNELQDEFVKEFDLTSSHKVRHSLDMQFAFSYMYYIIGAPKEVNVTEVFDEFDTDGSGILSDREIRTLATRLYDLPLDLKTLTSLENIVINCSKFLPRDAVAETLMITEKYFEEKMPQVTKWLVGHCDPLIQLMGQSVEGQTKYRYELMGEEEVAFKMIRTNVSQVIGQLDDIRKNPKKFVCLNDNIDHSSQDSTMVKAVLQDFYESIFPIVSQFELPREYRNRFLHIDELREWRRYRDWLRFWTHLSLGGLIVFSIASFCSTQLRALKRRCCPRRRARSHDIAEKVQHV